MFVKYYKDRVCGVDEELDLVHSNELHTSDYYALRFYEINLNEGFGKAVEYLQKIIKS